MSYYLRKINIFNLLKATLFAYTLKSKINVIKKVK